MNEPMNFDEYTFLTFNDGTSGGVPVKNVNECKSVIHRISGEFNVVK